jgi:hypothetical protein
MGKDPKPRIKRGIIEAGERQSPDEVTGPTIANDIPVRVLPGEAELVVSEICDSILHRLNQSEQRTRSHGRLKVESGRK